MKLTEIPEGEAVFIDANIFIYHFAGASEECKEFLKDCAKKELLLLLPQLCCWRCATV